MQLEDKLRESNITIGERDEQIIILKQTVHEKETQFREISDSLKQVTAKNVEDSAKIVELEGQLQQAVSQGSGMVVENDALKGQITELTADINALVETTAQEKIASEKQIQDLKILLEEANQNLGDVSTLRGTSQRSSIAAAAESDSERERLLAQSKGNVGGARRRR